MEIAPLSQFLRTDQPPSNVNQAAAQFEALLVSQILKAARPAGGESWLGAGSDASAAPAIEFAEEQLAAALCARGGLGLAAMIAQAMQPSDAQDEAAGGLR